MRRRTILFRTLSASLIATSGAALAQAGRPVRLVVPTVPEAPSTRSAGSTPGGSARG